MDVSVILWDAGFREKHHTIESLLSQNYPDDQYEIVWVEYFDEVDPELEVLADEHDAFRTHTLAASRPWHAGRCVNEGLRVTDNELVVVLDGDVVVRDSFLENVVAEHREIPELSMHVQRWDEQDTHHGTLEWTRLKEFCTNDNPENYGGCVTVRRRWLDRIDGCDEHPRFQRASAVFKDLHQRLVNLELEHRWCDSEILLHPWHPGTGAVAEHMRYKHQHRVIQRRRKHGTVAADWSTLAADGPPRAVARMHSVAYYLYAKLEGHLFDKAIVKPYTLARRIFSPHAN